MAHIDFKITIWERVTVDDDKVPDVIERIKNGSITSSSDLIDEGEYYNGILYDTSEQMTVQENGNQSTIEIFKNTDMVFSNVEK